MGSYFHFKPEKVNRFEYCNNLGKQNISITQCGNLKRDLNDVRYSRCRNRARVGLSVGISVTVSVPSNKVRVAIVLTKNVVKIISLVL